MILKLAMILMWTKPSLLVNTRPQSVVCVMSITRVYYEKRLRIMILGLVLSGSWDKTVHYIDIRDSTNPVVLNQPDKVYTMSVSDSKYIFSFLRVYELDWWSAQPTEWLMFMTLRTCQSPWRQERALCCIKHDALNALLMTRVFAIHKERLNRICYQFDWRTSWYRVLRQGIEGICNLWWLSAIEQAIRIQMSSSEGEWSWYGLSSQYDCLPSNVSPSLVLRWSSYGTFATGGGDGVVCVWDSNSRKKTAQFPRYFYIRLVLIG